MVILFCVLQEHSPCVLFIDEIDAICPKRETAQREMERRIVTQLLACLDGAWRMGGEERKEGGEEGRRKEEGGRREEREERGEGREGRGEGRGRKEERRGERGEGREGRGEGGGRGEGRGRERAMIM